MNKEEIVNNSVKHCCICDNKKYGEFISINDEKYHLCCIKQLQQENKQLKEIINKIKELMDKDQCAEYCYMDVADYLLELEKGDE